MSGHVDYVNFFRHHLTSEVYFESKNHIAPSPIQSKNKLIATHPWDFDYKRDKKDARPYWATASSLPKPELEPLSSSLSNDDVLKQYPAIALNICRKCYDLFRPVWGELRNELRKAQVQSQKGLIVNHHFAAILNKFDIQLSKVELGTIFRVFRAAGMADILKFDELFKVCASAKNLSFD